MAPSRGQDSLANTIERLRVFRAERGWTAYHQPRHLAVSIAVELGELMEYFQWGEVTAESRCADPAAFEGVQEELADVAIYALQLADCLGIDLVVAMNDKIGKNGLKHPRRQRNAA